MTRKGKIARLPRHIRDYLNRRLEDGEPSVNLVQWLNAQKDVQRVLDAEFDGRPMNEQNLTEWKQGGFLDWQRHQECREWAHLAADEASEISDDAGAMPLSASLAPMATFALGKVIRELSNEAPSDSKKRDDLLRVLREVGRLRRDDLETARARTGFELTPAQRQNSRRRAAASADMD